MRNLPNLVLRTSGSRIDVLSRDSTPDLVFSTGAAIALPFFMEAHGYGARTVFLEPVDRITTASLTGRLVYPFADRFLVQWESLREIYPEAVDIGVVL